MTTEKKATKKAGVILRGMDTYAKDWAALKASAKARGTNAATVIIRSHQLVRVLQSRAARGDKVAQKLLADYKLEPRSV